MTPVLSASECIHRAESTNDLPGGMLRMYQVNSESEALEIAVGREAWLYASHVISALYLFVPEMEAA